MSSFVLFPCYNDVYDGELPKLEELIAGIPTEIIVAFVGDTNARKHINQFDIKVDFEIFNYLIGRLPEEIRLSLRDKLEEFVLKVKAQICIFPLQQMLQLAEYSLANYVKEVNWEEISAEKEENILKAVLVLNSQNQIRSVKTFEGIKPFNSLENYIRISWPFMIDDIELYNTDISQINLPLLQSKMLFEYFDSNDEFKQYLKVFLEYYGISDPRNYIRNLLSLIFSAFNKEQGKFVSHYDTNSIESSPIFKHFIREINEDTSKIFKVDSKFFSFLREKPFFKTSLGRTYIISWGFVVDKIYEGIKYDFFVKSGINNKLDWGTYASKLGKFNEERNFHDMVIRYLQKEETVCCFDDKKEWNQDLYYRKDNHICFIEFKGVKLSMKSDFEEIKAEIDKKMVMSVDSKGKSQKKAVYQLIDQIKQFHDNINKFEQLNYNRKRLLIYPVIIFVDPLWKLPGINDYLGNIFREAIDKLELDFFHIEELVLINLDFFYIHEKAFLRDGIYLHELIYRSRQLKQFYKEIAKRAPNAQSVTNSHYSFDFLASNVCKGSYTFPQEQSIFLEIMKWLEIRD